ncbi:MAG: MFS transporter [Steroidobacteraceae bacterium]
MSDASRSSASTGAWAPLRHPEFAVLWCAGLISNIGSWMHDLAAGWFMATLDPKPYMVALVQAAYTLPVCLLAIPAGTLADRMDKRRLLLLVQWTMLVLATLLGVLVLGGKAGVVTLLLVTLGMGSCVAVMSPTWQAIVPGLVPKQDLQQAVALHTVSMNISRAIGPAIAGVIIAVCGIAWPFLLNGASFLAVIIALWWWRAPRSAPHASQREPYLAALFTGLKQVGTNAALRNTLWRSVLFFVFGSCYWALLPLVARDLLQGGPKLFGVLVGCIGVGAVSAALALPALRARWGLDRLLDASTLATAAALAGYALLHVPALGMLASFLAGTAWLASLSALIVAAQLAVPDALRARGMALFTAVFYGCLALGSLLWGQVATHLNLSGALLIAASGMLAVLPFARRMQLRP